MVNNCPKCAVMCPNFFTYQMHRQICKPDVRPYGQKQAMTKQPLTKEEKRVIVNRLETKLGKHHFFGGGY